MLGARRVHGPLALHCQLGNWIVMPPPTSMLQVNYYVRLSVSTRQIPLMTLLSGTQRARSRIGTARCVGDARKFGRRRHVVTQLVSHQPGGRGTESLVGTAPAAPPPPANAMRAGLGGGVPTGAVAATRARHGFGTVVLGEHSGRELGVVQVPRIGRSRVELERHGNLRILTGAYLTRLDQLGPTSAV